VGSASPLIAVVDDETAVGTMLRRALRLAGYEVATFASGQEFLDSLPACPPTCVILDIHMPGLSGFEVEVRMRAQDIRVPIVLITASDDSALDRSAAAAGAICLLRKPFSTDVLLAAVRRALGESASTAPWATEY
jgi:FixJ family two-component response regulator